MTDERVEKLTKVISHLVGTSGQPFLDESTSYCISKRIIEVGYVHIEDVEIDKEKVIEIIFKHWKRILVDIPNDEFEKNTAIEFNEELAQAIAAQSKEILRVKQ